MHRFSTSISPLGLVVLAACPVEQTYADLIKEHGNTYASESATHTTGGSAGDASTGDPGVPTSSDGGTGSAGIGDSSGETGTTSEPALSTGDASSGTTAVWADGPPELGGLAVAPKPVLAAGFVDLSVECSDDVGVVEVRFLVDGEVIAAATEAPFAAKWLVKSQDQAGMHDLAVECEDTAGHVVSTGEQISVDLPAPGSVAWSQVHAAYKGSAEAADASPAADGSWWVCGHADNVGGGTAVWVAHYSSAGEELFSRMISRGKDQTGRCSGVAVASEDGHRAVLTGGYGPTGLWPSMWTGLVDETEAQPVLAESNEALTAYWGNDVLVNKYGQFEVAGHRVTDGDDWDMAHQLYSYTPGKNELVASAGLAYGEPDFPDMATAIVENPDGTVTLVGTLSKDQRLHAAAVRLDNQHQVDNSGEWPFRSVVTLLEGHGAMDGSVDTNGNLRLAGWWRKSPNDRSQIMTLTIDSQGKPVGEMTLEPDPDVGDNAGTGVAHLSDGTFIVVGSVTTAEPEDHDIWLRRYGGGEGAIVFEGAYNLLDEPRRVRVNAFDQALVVGFETLVVLQDGNPTKVSRAWLRALN